MLQAVGTRVGLGVVVAVGVMLATAPAAVTPSRWPVPVSASSPAGRALLRSPQPKTVFLDSRTGAVTAVYAGLVLRPAPAELRPPWAAAGHATNG